MNRFILPFFALALAGGCASVRATRALRAAASTPPIECSASNLPKMESALRSLSETSSREVEDFLKSGGDAGELYRKPGSGNAVEAYLDQLNRMRACARTTGSQAKPCEAYRIFDAHPGGFRFTLAAREAPSGLCEASGMPELDASDGSPVAQFTGSWIWRIGTTQFPKCQTREDGPSARNAVLVGSNRQPEDGESEFAGGSAGILFVDFVEQPPGGDPNQSWTNSQMRATKFYIGSGPSMEGFRQDLALRIEDRVAKFVWANGAYLAVSADGARVADSNFIAPSGYESTCRTAHLYKAKPETNVTKRFYPDIQADPKYAAKALPPAKKPGAGAKQ